MCADHSVNTISQALTIWPNFPFHMQFDAVNAPKGVSDSGSGGQAFLDGCEFQWGKTWLNGHITLSPTKDRSGYCSSAHLTLVGGSEHAGNYFYEIDESGATPGKPPAGMSGSHSHNGNDLPQPLRGEIEKILDKLLTFPP